MKYPSKLSNRNSNIFFRVWIGINTSGSKCNGKSIYPFSLKRIIDIVTRLIPGLSVVPEMVTRGRGRPVPARKAPAFWRGSRQGRVELHRTWCPAWCKQPEIHRQYASKHFDTVGGIVAASRVRQITHLNCLAVRSSISRCDTDKLLTPLQCNKFGQDPWLLKRNTTLMIYLLYFDVIVINLNHINKF